MTIDVTTPRSPGWYLKRLTDKLDARRKRVDPLFARYNGDAPVPSSLKQAPAAAQAFYKASRTAFAEMVVKAVKYPLRAQSVVTSADTTETGDAEAWRMFVRSGMATEVDDVHRVSLTAGDAYAIVSSYRGRPTYTAEDPRQVVTLHDPVVQAEVIAAAKIFHHDEDMRDYAYLYRPGRVWRAFYDRRRPSVTRFTAAWTWDEEYGGENGRPLPAGFEDVMPVLRYRNEEGVGEFERHTDLLDRLDHMVLQGMTIATLQAFKQRAVFVSADDMPDEDEDGRPIDYDDVFTADPGALWKLPETAKLWESGSVDLTPVWTGIDKFIQQLSAVTFTPLAMFSPEGQNQSAAGAGFAREGRTFKIEDRQDRLGQTHAKALSLLFRLAGDRDREPVEDINILWRPAERYSLAEKSDAATKAKDIPWQSRMTDIWQYTPQQVRQMESQRFDDALLFPAQTEVAAAEAPQAVPQVPVPTAAVPDEG